ncbi:MAG: fumarylacetoacetate hydrolase family protein [Actinomycetota bacterium]
MLKELDIKTYLPGKIICVGMNYKSHINEQDGRFPDKPVLFSKANSCIIKDGQNIIYPKEVKELDYEVELAIIMGKEASKISQEEVMDFIYGYTIINDVTARDIQKNESQWYRAKSFDSFGPVGPEIVLKESIKDPQNLNLRSYVNGKIRQNSNTSDMIFSIRKLISYISTSITLKPGDLIATGTPAGVGLFAKNKGLLKAGDEVTCEIEGIEKLKNKVVPG